MVRTKYYKVKGKEITLRIIKRSSNANEGIILVGR